MSEASSRGFPILQYLGYALQIIKVHTIVIWLLAIIGLLSATSLTLRDTSWFSLISMVSMVLSTMLTPIAYGIYFHIIDDSYTSIRTIARCYIPRYLWLLIRMYVPVIFLAGLAEILSGGSGGGFLVVGIIFFSLLYLFVIPHFYCTGRQDGAISLGIGFLLRNLSAATPLLVIVLFLESTVMLVQHLRSTLLEQHFVLFFILEFVTFVSASLLDYAIFIILIFIIREADNPS